MKVKQMKNKNNFIKESIQHVRAFKQLSGFEESTNYIKAPVEP